MARHFNTAGPCLADKHYMLPPVERLAQVLDLIDAEKFFVIHAPRQTGKTTLLRNLSRELTSEGRYAAMTVSLETFTMPFGDRTMPQLLRRIQQDARVFLPDDLRPPEPALYDDRPLGGLKDYLMDWSAAASKPLVLLFDEIDSIPGDTLVSLLRQLRDGYCTRPAPFPASVALVGLKDVRDWRVLREIRQDQQSLGTASPFNVKDESLTLRGFTEDEVARLLGQHTEDTGQLFEEEAVREIFHQTRGQPWLVNALASQLTTRWDALVKDRSVAVMRDHVMEVREMLIERRDTHLDSLVDKLRDERVKRVLEPILTGESAFDETFNDDFVYTRNLGLVSRIDGRLAISNPIYQEIIPRVLSFQVQMGIADEPAWYVGEDGALEMGRLIDGFLEFWRGNGEVLLRGMPYHEAAPHLVLMAYLQRITNGGGMIHREFAVGTGRADLVVDFGGRKDIIEIKRAHTYKTLEKGREQVARYARRLGRDVGYLVVFDMKSDVPFEDRGEVGEIEEDGVTVVLVRA